MNTQKMSPPVQPGKKPRDLRLDFFRGIAMFIIMMAHTPGNTWTLWIPARFGFSDATEIFVFCSGMASALAFGAVYLKRSWFLGTARIAFRVWQVYWAHIGVILATAAMFVLIDRTGLGEEGRTYIEWPPIARLFTHTDEALAGYFTLTFIPGLFDILPMYLVILALVPVIMLAHKLGGRYAVFGFVVLLWFCAQLSGWARMADRIEDLGPIQSFFAMLGEPLRFLNLPGSPWNENGQWFFNPFGWQLVFFTGFAFGTGWLPAPPVKKWLLWVAALYLVAMLPFAWFQIHGGRYLPDEWLLHDWVYYTREWMTPLRWKTGVGVLRYLHFLALAYLAWSFVGPGGAKLREGFHAFGALSRPWLIVVGIVAFLTIPYAYVEEIKYIPALNSWILSLFTTYDLFLPEQRIGMAQIAHLIALMVLVWALIGAVWRQWLVKDAFLATVPIIRKVGTQSLAVFLMSIVLSRFNGWILDIIGRDVWTKGAVNLTGIAILIATAYGVGWFKGQPWREQKKTPSLPAGAASATVQAKDATRMATN